MLFPAIRALIEKGLHNWLDFRLLSPINYEKARTYLHDGRAV